MNKPVYSEPSSSVELLSTKLAPPRARAGLVPRRDLLARLDAGLEHKLTLLSAPAGFGKSTLAANWLATRAEGQGHRAESISLAPSPQSSVLVPHSAWVALDEGDNDPVRFWRYVLRACQAFESSLGAASLALLRQAQPPPYETLLTSFINNLAQLHGRFVLVLEDYHVIVAHQIHESLTFLLDHLPATLHLLLITRSDPPLPLARLRARDELCELHAADLRFSPAETQAFFAQSISLPLSPATLQQLDTRTEGWVAGLRLFALALRGQPTPSAIGQALLGFNGGDRRIAEYLIDDVLRAQPAPLQDFLLRTSILERLCADLCDALLDAGRTTTDESDCSLVVRPASLVLEKLERANLFLVPLDGQRHWYRYHALFAEAMREQARRQFGADGMRALYRRASRWYERQGQLADAVEAAFKAGDFAAAAALIVQIVDSPQHTNELHTLRRWSELLPEQIRHSYPSLCFAYAGALLFTEDRRAPATAALLQPPLLVAERHWRAAGDRPHLGALLTFRAMVHWWQGEHAQSFADARQAWDILPEQDVEWRGPCLLHLGAEALLAGRADAARELILEAQACCAAARNIHASLAAMFILADITRRQGQLHQAGQLYQSVIAEAGKVEFGAALDDRAGALLGLGSLAYEHNDLATARQHAAEALEISKQLRADELLVPAMLLLARVLHAGGETVSAQQQLDALLALPQCRRPWYRREALALQARLALARGELAAVQRWQSTYAQRSNEVPALQQEQEALLAARMLIAQHRAKAALPLLERWLADARANDRTGSVIEILMLSALAHDAQAGLPQAAPMLAEALSLAEAQGYVRLFVDEGPAMAGLLMLVRQHTPGSAPYLDALLAAFPSAEDRGVRTESARPKDSILSHQPSFYTEALSPQEQRVLQLLAAGLSNPEIAQELIVSVNTVKTQVQSIYRKLNLTSRSQARRVAQSLRRSP
jgi:LuxR family transcriptional regulator, maltose regulon positive regulatory protein